MSFRRGSLPRSERAKSHRPSLVKTGEDGQDWYTTQPSTISEETNRALPSCSPAIFSGHQPLFPTSDDAPEKANDSFSEIAADKDALAVIENLDNDNLANVSNDVQSKQARNLERRKASQDKIEARRRQALCCSGRLLICFLLAFGGYICYGTGFVLTYAMVCMVNNSYLEGSTLSAVGNPCFSNTTIQSKTYDQATYQWTPFQQSTILAAESWGSIPLIFLAGWILDRYGAHIVYGIGNLVLALATILIPVLADYGWEYVFAMRMLQGVGQMFNWPAIFVVTTAWFPENERGTVITMSMFGFDSGTMAAMALTGVFCDTSLGWQGIFYIFGGMSAIYGVVWLLIYRDNIDSYKFMSKREKRYIKENRSAELNTDPTDLLTDDIDVITPHSGVNHDEVGITSSTEYLTNPDLKTTPDGDNKSVHGSEKSKSKSTPWVKLLTSGPVWALIITNLANGYFIYFTIDYLPYYLKLVLAITDNTVASLLAGLPFAVSLLTVQIIGPLSDWVDSKIGPTKSVKLFNTLSGLLGVAGTALLPQFNCFTIPGAVAMFALIFFSIAVSVGGYQKAQAYLAPQFTGTITGLAVTFCYIGGLIAPYVTEQITREGLVSEWHTCMYISAAIEAAGTIYFLIFASAEVQDWAKTGEEEEEEEIDNTIVARGSGATNGLTERF